MWCKNKGTCYVDDKDKTVAPGELPPLKCQCPPQWMGKRCEHPVSLCRKVCHNGATCSFAETKIQCHCTDGYYGDNCENCQDMECSNGGVCRKTTSNKSVCVCPEGFDGRACEKDSCKNYCSANGVCKAQMTGPRCECHPGYSGDRCEMRKCELECLNGGTCVLVDGGQSMCSCPSRFTGSTCDYDLCEQDDVPSECISQPCESLRCENGGNCFVRTDGPACDCPRGYSGDLCEVSVELFEEYICSWTI